MVMKLTDEVKTCVAQAVQEAEQCTSGELVTVIAEQADEYREVPLFWAALFSLTVPTFLWLWLLPTPPGYFIAAQLGSFVVIYALLSLTPLRYALVSTREKTARAQQLARAQFLQHGLHRTRDRTGVLIFVSLAEHYVEIIADEGIHSKVPPGYWDEIVQNFIARVRKRELSEGLMEAVKACGGQLAQHFPRRVDDVNELPNTPLEM